MSTVVTVAGSNYSVPQEGDTGWANDVTDLLIQLATSSKVLQITSTSFPLLQELSFGNTYGLKSAYIKSVAANPSGTGIIRLGNTEGVSWRNAGNTLDLALTVNASDDLTYNSTKLALSGNIVNADINASAAIAYSKLNIADGDLAIAKTNGLQTALNNLAPMTTAGDIIKGGASGVPERLAIGATDTLLRSNGTTVEWSSAFKINSSNNATLASAGAKTLSVYGTTSGDTSEIDIGNSGTVGGCTLKLIANAAGTGLTITRSAGTNNVSQIIHYGTSKFSLINNGAAIMGFSTSNTERMTISPGGDLVLASAGSKSLSVYGTTAGDLSTINIGNGATAGTSTLNLIGSATADANRLRLNRAAGENANSFIDHLGTGILYLRALQAGAIRFETNSTMRFTISSAGVYKFAGLADGSLSITGSDGTLTSSSSADMKIDDGFIKEALPKIMKVTPRYYYWKPEYNLEKERQLGFYAQEINKALGEEAANTPADGKSWGIYDRAILAMAVKAIQELSIKLDEANEKIIALEKDRKVSKDEKH